MREFDLIKKIRRQEKIIDKKVIRGIGDDCAVIDRGAKYELITTDMLVEDDHFKLDWYSPEQIGAKAMQANLSDIAAMGGIPKYAFVSLCLSKKVEGDWVERVYRGLRIQETRTQGYKQISIPSTRDKVQSSKRIQNLNPKSQDSRELLSKVNCQRSNVLILGGDITHGEKMVINICLVGEVLKKYCCFRSGAKVGDLICVTGELGGSAAGLELLKSEIRNPKFKINPKLKIKNLKQIPNTIINYCINKHLSPRARILEGPIIAKYASAMIDVSDGLGSEVRHIGEESGVGARVYAEKVPMGEEVKEMGEWMEEHANMRTCEQAHLQKFQIPIPQYGTKFQTNYKLQNQNFKRIQGLNEPKNVPYYSLRPTIYNLPLHWAMSGGEDYELVFTVSAKNLEKLKKELVDAGANSCSPVRVGEILEKKRGIKLIINGKEQEMPGGFVHF